jgi:hypothetical protein
MNLLLQLLVAALLIALMIVVRMVADHRVLQQRLACEQYGKTGCSSGCSKTSTKAECRTDKHLKRRAHHAP